MTTPALSVRGIERSYKDLHVLRGVDFEVERGSIFALLGSNGAGKTTMVRILSTLLKSDAGTATVQGIDVAANPVGVRRAHQPHRTVRRGRRDPSPDARTSSLVAKLRHLPDAGAVADRLSRGFRLTEAGGRKVGTYSGGMRRRLDIAMSPGRRPEVIYLDEPTRASTPSRASRCGTS
ncbi:hypothetical protein CTI14_19865 [Methylobacterium radiotolerans]|nr:hypothetical protein CTI14_19865 [Methylobacterium radiotolerans]